MIRARNLAFGLVLSVIGLATTASAQTAPATCAERSQALSHLQTKYSETPVAIGLASNGSIVEVTSSGAGETWSILVTMPNGMTCLIASGEDWEKVAPQTAERPADGPLL